MINTIITGSSHPSAGELIRLLINHPDVEIKYVCDKVNIGVPLTQLHHGLIGETDLSISPTISDFSGIDLIFTLDNSINIATLPDSVKTINLLPELMSTSSVYAIPELNRKPLVRGAKHADIPTSPEVAITILLLPILHSTKIDLQSLRLDINIAATQDVANLADKMSIERISENIGIDSNKIILSKTHLQSANVIKATIEISNQNISSEYLLNQYKDYYSDHNLTHVVNYLVNPIEVKNTDKALVSITDADFGNNLKIQVTADPQLRGAAGDAIHVMNLLFGLYEKTGLALKASTH